MHTQDFEITLENISKIEGHAEIGISVKGKKVKDVKLRINENRRFYTQAVRGKVATGVAQIVSRICGTCSIAHQTACTEAVERGLGITPSDQTLLLRNLLLYGLNIRDHAMHLYLFCLPDIYGKDSILDFPDDGPLHEQVHHAFDIKSAGNRLSIEVGGRAVHAPLPVVGGFLKMPNVKNLKMIAKELEAVRNAAIEFVDVFYNCHFSQETDASFVSLLSDRFTYLGDELASSEGICIPEWKFPHYLQKIVLPYSQAPGFQFVGRPYIVGAISRINLNGGNIHRRTRKDLAKYLSAFPSTNIYHNNLAQAIEIVHCIDHSIEIIDSLELKDQPPVLPKPPAKEVEGVGAIEAPRGTLYYNLKITPDLKIANANLVIPTAQNQVNMEKEIGKLVQHNLDVGRSKAAIQKDIEKLIRAYDPCMSCATNFLKLRWKEE
jgi:coenzyme F420-reducing hydrogenase alpha subunit